MGFSNDVGALAHDAMHRLPWMPDHARASELNTQHQRALRNRSLRNRPMRNRPVRNGDGHHDRPARLFADWQAWLAQRFRQGLR
jgi:hypothetical protein